MKFAICLLLSCCIGINSALDLEKEHNYGDVTGKIIDTKSAFKSVNATGYTVYEFTFPEVKKLF